MRRLPKSRSRPGHGSKKVVTSEAMRRILEKFASLAARWRDRLKVKGIKAVRGSSAGSARTCPRKSAERLYFFDFPLENSGSGGGTWSRNPRPLATGLEVVKYQGIRGILAHLFARGIFWCCGSLSAEFGNPEIGPRGVVKYQGIRGISETFASQVAPWRQCEKKSKE